MKMASVDDETRRSGNYYAI